MNLLDFFLFKLEVPIAHFRMVHASKSYVGGDRTSLTLHPRSPPTVIVLFLGPKSVISCD